MKQKSIPILMFGLFAVALLTHCSKQGPTGPAGPQGAQGNTGAQGPKGDTGTANVKYSAWDSSFSGTYSIWAAPAITAGVLDSSVVLVYARQNGFVWQLPYDNINGSGFFINNLLDVGHIYLFCSTGNTLNQFAFRYMIIPGSVAIQKAHQDYQQIVDLFKIQP